MNEAMVGHASRMMEVIDDLVELAAGDQYRCSCGQYGPKVPKLGLKEATEIAKLMMQAAKDRDDVASTMISVTVVGGVQIVPNRPAS